jgi:uncharacterized phiE125 gp8 family phage protein
MITEKAVDKKGNRFWTTTVEPTTYPVTVAEVKEFARIDGNEEDSILEAFIAAVVNNVEAYLRKALITRTIKMIMDEWNSNEIELPMPPLISVTSVKTVDESDVETTYSSDNYYVVTESIPGRIIIKKSSTAPTNTERETAGYNIIFTAGYGNNTNIPKQIKIAIMQWVTMIYENRAMGKNDIMHNEPPPDVRKMLQPFKVERI